MIKTIGGIVGPYLTKGLAIAAALAIAGAVILYFKADAAEARADRERERADRLDDALKESERTLSVVRAQHIAASAVAESLREEREKDRVAARRQDQGIRNAPIDQNRVVPGVLPLAIDGLRRGAPDR